MRGQVAAPSSVPWMLFEIIPVYPLNRGILSIRFTDLPIYQYQLYPWQKDFVSARGDLKGGPTQPQKTAEWKEDFWLVHLQRLQ